MTLGIRHFTVTVLTGDRHVGTFSQMLFQGSTSAKQGSLLHHGRASSQGMTFKWTRYPSVRALYDHMLDEIHIFENTLLLILVFIAFFTPKLEIV